MEEVERPDAEDGRRHARRELRLQAVSRGPAASEANWRTPLSEAEGYYLGQLGKGKAPAAPAGDTSKPAMVKLLTDTFDWSIGVVGQLSAADFTKSFGAGKGPAMTGLELLYQTMIHTAHTRGYAEMFLRNKGVVPPTYAV